MATHTKADIRQTLTDILVAHYCVEQEDIKDESRFKEDLQLDSLDVIELSVDVEIEFAIEITDDEMEKVVTFNDAVELIAKILCITN